MNYTYSQNMVTHGKRDFFQEIKSYGFVGVTEFYVQVWELFVELWFIEASSMLVFHSSIPFS